MYTMGIDIGSVATKCVILRDGQETVAGCCIPKGTGTSGTQQTLERIYRESGLQRSDISYLIATGYGRTRFEDADDNVSELTCHTRGVSFFVPDVRTIIDIGGQDAKAIQVGENGRMLNFVMNDKCAAGTGRFLEVMSSALETTVDQLGELSARSTIKLNISATCTVFAESEVISLMSSGFEITDIIAGIHTSVARRVGGLAKRVGIEPRIVMTGGVAQNSGIVRAMEEELKMPVSVIPQAQLTGAYGAARIAWERATG